MTPKAIVGMRRWTEILSVRTLAIVGPEII